MIAGLKPYPEYKESGVPWLGRIPSHWALERAKWLFRKMDRPAGAEDDVVTCFRDGIVTLRKNRRLRGFTESLKEIGYQGIRREDLVIHAMDAFAGAVGVSDSDGKGSPVYSVCQPRSGANPRYYAQVVREMARSEWILALSRGIRERSTDFRFETFGRQILPTPPEDEQRAMAQFFAVVNVQCRRLTRAKKKLIALLNEQKLAVIHNAVTRGLDPTVRLKASGISCLGDIPKHWEVQRFRMLVHRIDQGVSPQAAGFLADDSSWGVLKSGCVNGGVFRQIEHKQLPKTFEIDPSIVVRIGDVLISRACGSPKFVGSVGIVDVLNYRLILSDKTFRPVFRPLVNVQFAVRAMNSPYFRRQVEEAISGAEGLANNLPLSSLRDFRIAVPPPEEAAAIAASLTEQVREFDVGIDVAEREIGL